jgi:hypothetical protein
VQKLLENFNVDVLIIVIILYKKIIEYIDIERLKAGVHPDRPVVHGLIGAAMLVQDMA